MRNIWAIATACFLSATGYSQECNGYYYMNNGEVQMTIYDKKGKENGKITYTITGVNKSGGSTTAKFTSLMTNDKGKTMSQGAGRYKCSGGVMFVDARVAMPGEQMTPYKDMEVKAEEMYIEYPASLSEGQSLKDVNFKMEVLNGAAIHSTVTMEETNRKVVGKESVTTPAGTWDCYKITYDGKFKATMAPLNIGIPFTMQATEWFAPGFGVVKTESKNKNGKLLGSTVITSVKK